MTWKHSLPRSATVALILASFSTPEGSEVRLQRAASQPIRQIDHIMIRAGDPRELYAFFVETLQLPIAWPMTSPRAGVMTGGVGVGNVNVEAIQFPAQTDERPRLLGFAFEPSVLDDSVIELKRRGLTVGERRPLTATGPDGSKRTLWTNVTLQQFSDSDNPAEGAIHIFLSEYSPTYVDVEQRRTRLRRELQESGGGPLGVKAVKEVIVGTTDLNAAVGLWGRLLEPRRPSAPGLWQVGDGPAIRVVRAGESKLQGLVISVVSLRQAKAFLRAKGLLGSVTEKDATIDPSKIQSLNIRLVEDR
jgi:catechol 2,3-dioxygenase-like lactoylglutathione lyase family enzyme